MPASSRTPLPSTTGARSVRPSRLRAALATSPSHRAPLPTEKGARATTCTSFSADASCPLSAALALTSGVTEAFLPLLQKADAPRVVNVASTAGLSSLIKDDAVRARFTRADLTVEELEAAIADFEVRHLSLAGSTAGRKTWTLTRELALSADRRREGHVDRGGLAFERVRHEQVRPFAPSHLTGVSSFAVRTDVSRPLSPVPPDCRSRRSPRCSPAPTPTSPSTAAARAT